MPPAIQANLCLHKEKNIIAVQFAYDKELVRRFRQLPGARWSNTLKCGTCRIRLNTANGLGWKKSHW